MSPITHFLASWTAADTARLRGRDAALATWCGLLPDADGIGLSVDLANRVMGRYSYYYWQYHHTVLHGLFGALAIPLAMCALAKNRLRVFVMGFVAVHLHLVCDAVGSRGPTAADLWPIPYLAPFSRRWTFQWAGQWPLDAWPNFAFTGVLLVYAFWRAIGSDYSPVGIFSRRADRVFVETVKNRWDALRRGVSRQVSQAQ